MSKKLFFPDQEIFIEVKGQFSGWYPTIILEIYDDKIMIAAPTYQGAAIPFVVDQLLNCYFNNELGIYEFKSRVDSRGHKPRPYYIIEMPENLKRVQRRDFVRIRIREKIKYRQALAGEKNLYIEQKTAMATAINISGGGLLFWCQEPVALKQLLWLEVPFINIDQDILGLCVRSVQKNKRLYEIAVAFKDLARPEQEKIIQWIFEYQRKQRRQLR